MRVIACTGCSYRSGFSPGLIISACLRIPRSLYPSTFEGEVFMKRRGLVPVERRVSSLSTAIAVIATLLQPVLASSGFAQWSIDPFVNNAISSEADEQTYPTIASDGAGGAIITWIDGRSGDDDIYAQRIDAAGVVQWTAGGVAISTAANGQYLPTIVSDGAGGAIVAWYDSRSGASYDIYA